jgi:hypothetical protein
MLNFAAKALMMAVCLAIQVPAHATILLGGATPEETALLEEKAHQAGARHTNVVGLTLEFHDGDLGMISYATGVYIGLTDDGQTGLVLSAGHAFDQNVRPKGLRSPKRAWVSLGPKILGKGEAGSVMIPAVRVELHPEFRWSSDSAHAWTTNDLALVAFDASIHREALRAHGIAPAKLRADHESKPPLIEAELVGFGRLGTHACRTLTSPRRVHSGHTWVTPGIVTGRTVLLHRSPVFTVGEGKDTVHFGFDRIEAGLTIKDPETGLETQLRSHQDQALGAPGDSGGPLFFNTSEGLEVAGIYSGCMIQSVEVVGTLEDEFVNTQVWEPVARHLSWIQSCRQALPESPLNEQEGAPKSKDVPAETKGIR